MQTSASCGPGSDGLRAGNPPSARHHQETSPLRMGRRYRSTVIREDFRVASLIMRLGVLDVGSNTVHLLVVDAYPGARPLPAFSHKVEMRLAAPAGRGAADPRLAHRRPALGGGSARAAQARPRRDRPARRGVLAPRGG